MKKVLTILTTVGLSLMLLTSVAWAKTNTAKDSEQKADKTIVAVTNEEQDGQAVEKDVNKGQAKKVIVVKEKVTDQAKAEKKLRKLEERIKVRGMNLKFDVPPVIKEGRTLIPVRAIMNGLGAKVEYNFETKIVTITRDGKTIVLNLATGEAKVDGVVITIDVPAQVMNNRTFVPLRFVAQTLGEKVSYDDETGDIAIGDTDTNDTDEDATTTTDTTGTTDTTTTTTTDTTSTTGTTTTTTTTDTTATTGTTTGTTTTDTTSTTTTTTDTTSTAPATTPTTTDTTPAA
jgi:hypothetical protein